MRKLSALLIIIALILVGCSSKKAENVKKEGDSIRGVVVEIDNDTFTIDSRDRIKQGKVIVTKRVELKGGEVDFKEGDTITIFYDKIEGSRPAIINKVFALELNKESEDDFFVDTSENDDDDKVGHDDVDYYEMPILTIVKDGESTVTTESTSALIHDILHSVPWEEGAKENHEEEYKIMDDIEVIASFDSKTNVLNDIENEVSVELHPELATTLLKGLNGDL